MKPSILLIILPLMISKIIIIDSKYISLSCPLIGPYQENSGDKKIEVHIHNSNSFIQFFGKLSVKISNDELPLTTYYVSPTLSIPNSSKLVHEVPFTTDYFFNRKMKVELLFQVNDGKIASCDFELESIKPECFEIEKLKNQTYSKDKAFVRITNNKVTYFNEKFDFQFYPKNIYSLNYYRLTLDYYNFDYDSFGPLVYDDAYLSFEDSGNLFPLIEPIGESMEKRVPVELRTNLPDVFPFFKSPLYVDPTYLLMSNSYKEGLVKTNHFYLPINRLKELNGYQFKINIERLGQTKNSFSFSFTYQSDRYLIGSCQNSDYCVVGGIYK